MVSRGLAWDDRFGRLPKWAQQKVETLLRATQAAEEQAEALRQETNPETAAAVLVDYVTGETGIDLTKYRHIRLYPFGRGGKNEDRHFIVSNTKDGIEVRAGWDVGLGIKPHVTNVIEVVDLNH